MHVTSYLFIFIGHYNVKQAKRERHALPTGAVRNELEEPRKFPNINYLGSSYNIFKGNPHSTEGLDPGFMGQGLYEFSYHQGKVTPDGRYCIPDNMSVMESLACSFDFSSRSIKEITSYFQSLEVDVDADFTGYGASFSASTNYKEVKENTDSREMQYVSSHAYCEAYLAALEPGANLAEGFIRAVNGLPNTTNNAKYFDFIRAYGTHYVASVRMGGRYGFQSKFETNSYMSMLSTGLDVSAAAGYSATVECNAAASSEEAKKLSTKFNSYRQSYSIYQVGGQPPNNTEGTAMDWAQTVKDDPLPVHYRLEEIASLLTEDYFPGNDIETKQALLRNATITYCNYLSLPFCGSKALRSDSRIRIVLSNDLNTFGENVFYQTVNNPYLAVMGMFLRSKGTTPPQDSYALVDSRYAPENLIKNASSWECIQNDKASPGIFWRPNCDPGFSRLTDFQCPRPSKVTNTIDSEPDCLRFLPKILPCLNTSRCLTQCSTTEVVNSSYHEYLITNGFKMFGNGNADMSGDLNFITVPNNSNIIPDKSLFMCLTSECVQDF